MSESKPPTFKLDDDKDVLGRLCALSWFDGVRGEYELLVNVGEDDARELVAKLTAWLDAPRLAARKTPEVVAQIDEYALIRTGAGEWGTRTDGGVEWSANEADARAEFRDLTGAELCESCGEYRDREDVAATDDGCHVCIDETACNAAIAAKEP